MFSETAVRPPFSVSLTESILICGERKGFAFCMKKKQSLGTLIIAIVIAAFILAVAVILVVSLSMFSKYNDSLLVSRAEVGMSVLANTFENETKTLHDQFVMWEEDPDLSPAIASRNNEYFTKAWKNYATYAEKFYVITDKSGTIVSQSSFYPLKNLNMSEIARGKTIAGIYKEGDVLTSIYAAPLSRNGSVFGAMLIGLDLSEDTWMEDVKTLVEADVTVFNGNMRYATTLVNSETGNKMVGTPMAENIEQAVIKESKTYQGTATINKQPYYVSYEPMTDYTGAIVGAYFAGFNAVESNAEFRNVTIVSVVIALIAVAITTVILLVFIRKRVVTPINKVSELAGEMVRGQLSTTNVRHNFANDEVGQFAGELQETKRALSACVSDIASIMNTMSMGDFTRTPSVQYPGDFESIEQSIHKIENDLGETLSKMNISSEEVLTGSNQMAEGSQSLADGTTRQASAIQEISATIADVSTQIASTAKNAAQAGDLSKQTEEKVIYQDGEIRNMVNAMNEISETSKKIENIIKTIEDIAFQTNILALNAAVEAARAGEAGKGFAVVADEVRVLASKSAEAAASTTALITASIDAVGKGAKIAFATADAMNEVKEMSANTANLINEIATASAEQNNSIRQITQGVDQISNVIQKNSATAEETAASCEELSGQSRILKEQVARFKIKRH